MTPTWEKLIGYRGNDTIYGRAGSETIYGDDVLRTDIQGGDDYLDGGTGNDKIYGGYGHDTIYGGHGNDELFGDDDNDMLVGGPGTDDLYGGKGDDSIYIESPDGSRGDQVWGGEGQDTFVFGENFTTTITTETTISPSYNWTGLATGAPVDLMGIAIDAFGLGTPWKVGKGVVSLASRAVKGLFGFGPDETVTTIETYVPGNLAQANAVQIYDFNPQEDVLVIPMDSEASNVYTVVDQGKIYVKYHNGNDTAAIIHIDTSGDYFGEYGLHDANTGTSSAVAESVKRSAFTLDSTEAGDLVATLGTAYKTANNDSDNDESEKAKIAPTDDHTTVTTVTNVDLGADFLILGAYGNNAIAPGGAAAENLYGTMHEDRLFSYAVDDRHDKNGSDKLFGFGGNDVLAGGGGADDYYGGYGFDIVSYAPETGVGADNETLPSGIRVDLSYKSANIDTNPSATSDNVRFVNGLPGAEYGTAKDVWGANDRLFSIEGIIGSQYDDTITGGSKDNLFNGGAGADTLTGGSGADTFVLGTTQGGTDVITDFSLTDNDVILIDNAALDKGFWDAYWLGGTRSGTDLELKMGGETLATIEGVSSADAARVVGRVELTPGSTKLRAISGTNADIIAKGDGNDTFSGGVASDILSGGAGDDTLYGNSQPDLLLGGRGDDLLVGGMAADRLFGGSGADTFYIDVNSGNQIDNIRDFSAAENDRIQIKAAAFGIGVNAYDAVTFNNGNLMVNNTPIARANVNSLVTDGSADVVLV